MAVSALLELSCIKRERADVSWIFNFFKEVSRWQ